MRTLAAVLLSLLVLSSAPQAVQDPAEPPPGRLDLVVMIVADDLQLKPVPKWRFTIERIDASAAPTAVTTSFSGQASLELPPGDYSIRSDDALEFGNRRFRWSRTFTIAPGQPLTLELSNDNAAIEIASAPAAAVPMDEGALYQAVRRRVFKVLSESGHGSGFLVDAEHGLVATNHHVIAGSDYLAIKIDEKTKVSARVVAADGVNDVAVLQLNPAVVAHLEPVRLATDSPAAPPCKVGDRVVAIGSPLATETILTSGLVSKIEEGAIYSDVNVNPGNSGGPLFDARGEVIGINTFGLVTGKTAGIAGVIRVHLLHDLLAAAYAADLSGAPEPELLPVESSFRFPADGVRQAALTRDFEPRDYHVEAGKFDVQLVTPVLIAGLEVAAEKAAALAREKRNRKKKQEAKTYEPGQDFYEWRKYAGDYRAVITIQAVPEIKLTGGSIFAAVMLGANAPQRYKFKADFDRMELWRGETLVRPIHPRRWANVISFQQGTTSMQDIGYYGSYEYPPEAFKPGETLTLQVWKQGVPKPIVKVVPPEQQRRVWDDFASYFEALEASLAE